jgi:hypothetical protein
VRQKHLLKNYYDLYRFPLQYSRSGAVFFPCLLDIFKKDRTAYVHYIYAIISARQGMVNVPHTKAAVDQRAGLNALFENLMERPL